MATDLRAGANVRIKARRTMWLAAKPLLWPLACVTAAAVVMIAAANTILIRAGSRWQAGLFTGAVATAVLLGLFYTVASVSGALSMFNGADAETKTAAALKRLHRAGWTHVSDVYFPRFGNTDHVAVGPAGIFAIETKYTTRHATETPYEKRMLVHAGDQAKRNAKHVRLRLRAKPHGMRTIVQPVVVLWGGWDERPDIESVDGTTFVRGRAVATWAAQLVPCRDLDPDDRVRVIDALRAYCELGDSQQAIENDSALVQHGAVALLEGVSVVFVLLSIAVFGLRHVELGDLWLLLVLFTGGLAAHTFMSRFKATSRPGMWLRVAATVLPITGAAVSTFLAASLVR